VTSTSALEEKLREISAQNWKGDKLPFPVLMDSTSRTFERYGIRKLPTNILVAPDGSLALVGSIELLDELEKKLRE
jgi:hypothetical protein